VDFTEADLRNVNFLEADLSHANLTDAQIGKTVFGATNLTETRGLECCWHYANSVIDHSTLIKSGKLPLPFLRGCGVPDRLIEYAASLWSRPIQFYSCFVSHSSKDHNFAEQLYADLQDNGVPCWFAPHKIQPGKRLHDQSDHAIRLYDRLLLILSDNSMKSEWVKTEIAYGRRKEINEGRQVLFPISLVPFSQIKDWKCLESDTGTDLSREIRQYYILDFSNWKERRSYERTLEHLVEALKMNRQRAAVQEVMSSNARALGTYQSPPKK